MQTTFDRISVLVASFLIHFLADGLSFSFGVLFVAILEDFNETRPKTAVIGSLFYAIPLLCGPLASYVTQRFGCRNVTIMGGVLISLGFLICSLSHHIVLLYAAYGTLIGFGMCLCYTTAVVALPEFYEDSLGIALGIALCGSGLGTFAISPLTEYLLDQFGLQGTFLLIAGMCLHFIICGVLMPDVMNDDDSETEGSSVKNEPPGNGRIRRTESCINIQLGDLHRKALWPLSNSVQNLNLQPSSRFNSESEPRTLLINRQRFATAVQSVESIRTATPSTSTKSTVSGQQTESKVIQYIAVIRMPQVQLFLAANFLLYLFNDAPYVYWPDFVIKHDVRRELASLIPATMGILGSLGNVILGCIASKVTASQRIHLLAVSLLFCGGCLIWFVYLRQYWLFVLSSGFYGLFMSAEATVGPTVLLDYVQTDRFTTGFGILTFFQGAATLIGPPVAGMLYDSTQDYVLPFSIAGSCIILSSICIFCIICVRNKSKR